MRSRRFALPAVALIALASCSRRDAASAADSAAAADTAAASGTSDSADSGAAPAAESAAVTATPPPANTEGPLAGETYKAGGTMGQRNPPTDSIS